eukprot:gb/GEZN01009322.1/.p1 GENE.gb/GEZN01009322.1/~~gb/GEZN01009322.1/.p1  ORF type:complete len:390 (-),score=99.04 gb/GEZN01009322.1/:60-1229(-)
MATDKKSGKRKKREWQDLDGGTFIDDRRPNVRLRMQKLLDHEHLPECLEKLEGKQETTEDQNPSFRRVAGELLGRFYDQAMDIGHLYGCKGHRRCRSATHVRYLWRCRFSDKCPARIRVVREPIVPPPQYMMMPMGMNGMPAHPGWMPMMSAAQMVAMGGDHSSNPMFGNYMTPGMAEMMAEQFQQQQQEGGAVSNGAHHPMFGNYPGMTPGMAEMMAEQFQKAEQEYMKNMMSMYMMGQSGGTTATEKDNEEDEEDDEAEEAEEKAKAKKKGKMGVKRKVKVGKASGKGEKAAEEKEAAVPDEQSKKLPEEALLLLSSSSKAPKKGETKTAAEEEPPAPSQNKEVIATVATPAASATAEGADSPAEEEASAAEAPARKRRKIAKAAAS